MLSSLWAELAWCCMVVWSPDGCHLCVQEKEIDRLNEEHEQDLSTLTRERNSLDVSALFVLYLDSERWYAAAFFIRSFFRLLQCFGSVYIIMRIQARVKFCLDPFGHQLLQLSFRVRNQFYFCFYLLDPADPEGLRLCRSGSETLHCSSGFRSLVTIAGARPIYFGPVPAPGDITVNGMPELTLNPFICRYSRKTRNYSMLYTC